MHKGVYDNAIVYNITHLMLATTLLILDLCRDKE